MLDLAAELVAAVMHAVWDLICRVLDKAGVGRGLRGGPQRQPDEVLGLRESADAEHPEGSQ